MFLSSIFKLDELYLMLIPRLIKFFFISSLFLFLPSTLIGQADSIVRLKLLFAGDIMGHTPQIESAEIIKNKVYDYNSCFQYIAPLLQEADLAIANLEVTLPGKPPYTGWPLFKSPDDLVRGLKNAGFDILLTANNHANDAHKEGFIHTIDAIEKEGILQTGTFRNIAERDLNYPLIVYKKGFKLAFLNYTYSLNGISTKAPTIVNEIDEEQIRKDIIEARKLRADAIIVVMHWGREYKTVHSDRQEKLALKMFKWGVDLIVGAHPHVVQTIESYQVKRGNGTIEKVLVAYSLGNFISNQRQKNTDGGILLEVELTKNLEDKKSREARLTTCKYLPIWRYMQKDSPHYNYFTLPISPLENEPLSILRFREKDYKAMKKYARDLREQLKNAAAEEKKISQNSYLKILK